MKSCLAFFLNQFLISLRDNNIPVSHDASLVRSPILPEVSERIYKILVI